ncbi:MAG: HAD-IA family hydrolase [Clostridia bacterium]|nr:HAD-IA family hydrolase [Clostridia bacterium]
MGLYRMHKEFEDYLYNKIMSFPAFILAKLIEPDMEFNDIHEIDEHRIKDFKENYGIEAIILDVDQTIRNDDREIPECSKQWINLIKRNFKVIVLSNGWSQDAQKYFKSQGIDYIYLAFKPAKWGFKLACKSLGVRPDHVLVIGDSLYDDIHGAHKNNMMAAQVKKVKEDEDFER